MSGQQQIAQAMQAEDGPLRSLKPFPAVQKNDRIKTQQQTGAQQPEPTVQMIAEF
jgi:hypothetical protein